MAPGKGHRLRPRSLAAASLAAAAILAAPAGAAANVTAVAVDAATLEISGLPGAPSAVEVSHQAGAGGVGGRYEIADEGGILASGPGCEPVSPTLVSCEAGPVTALAAGLGDGDDVMVLDATAAGGVPASLVTRLAGGPGADVIRGGPGDDRILGGPGRDTLAGWSGDDRIDGGPGADGLIGFAGNDRLRGNGGRDALFGQKGRDFMYGGPQNDVILARDGFKDPVISCGGGKRQRATTDARDPEPRNCTTPGDRKKRQKDKRRRAKAVAALAEAFRSVAPPRGE